MVPILLASLAGPATADIDAIVRDMTEPHEAKPSGVPVSTGWALKPRVGMGNDTNGFRAFIPWGQVYAAEGGSPATNARVEIRALQSFILSKKTGKWTRVGFGYKVAGNAYVENFEGDVNKPANQREEPGGSISVMMEKGYNYHFWTTRVAIAPDDIGGVVSAVQARLVLDDPKKPDDRAKARLMMSVGADYWKAMDSQWDQWKTNGDAGIGRFRFIRNRWSWHYMSTIGPAELRKNPPPAPSVE